MYTRQFEFDRVSAYPNFYFSKHPVISSKYVGDVDVYTSRLEGQDTSLHIRNAREVLPGDNTPEQVIVILAKDGTIAKGYAIDSGQYNRDKRVLEAVVQGDLLESVSNSLVHALANSPTSSQ
jgi:hypothetical protein